MAMSDENCLVTVNENIRKNKRTFAGLGVCQIVCGLWCVGIGQALLVVCSYSKDCTEDNHVCACNKWTSVGANIWGGILVLVYGSLAICQSNNPTKCPPAMYLSTSVVGLLTSGLVFGVEVTAAANEMNKEDKLSVYFHAFGAVLFFISGILFIASFACAKLMHKECFFMPEAFRKKKNYSFDQERDTRTQSESKIQGNPRSGHSESHGSSGQYSSYNVEQSCQ